MSEAYKVKHGKRFYKGMSIEVGVRNPDRLFDMLSIINGYEGRVLDDDCILDIYADFYRYGIVSSTLLSDDDISNMTDEKLKRFIRDNDKHNNEWGFPTGYQAGFTRYLKTLSELGFIYTQYCQRIRISAVAKSWLNEEIDTPTAFSLQTMRFWRKSPYRRVLNDFNYFAFVLKVLIKLGETGRKLSYPQFVLSLYSDDGDVDKFIQTLEQNKIGSDLHATYLYILENYNLVDEDHWKVPSENTVTRDYADSVFRILRLTDLVSVENNGIVLISINEEKREFLNYLLRLNFSISEEEKEDEIKYFEKLGSFPDDLKEAILTFREDVNYSDSFDYNKKLNRILDDNDLSIDQVVKLINDLCANKRIPREKDKFWYLSDPLKLEFYITLLLNLKYGDRYKIEPNYNKDGNGIPSSHAPGNVGDILVSSDDVNWLIEVTLIKTRRQQYNDETTNCIRHFRNSAKNQQNYLSFVAPRVFDDTKEFYDNSLINMIRNHEDNLYLKSYNVDDFISTTLDENNFDDMIKFKQGVVEDIRSTFGAN